MADDLAMRVRRIYAAINRVEAFDLAEVPATVIRTPKIHAVLQDFHGGMSEEEIANDAHMLIYNIANLGSHLRRWAKENGKDEGRVNAAFDNSLELRILKDLSNNDRHGPPDKPGNSKFWPWLREINRVMQLRPAAGKGMAFFLSAGGKANVAGDGSASVVITGQVVDKDGKILGDLFSMEQKAVEVWEKLLAEYGIDAAAR
jgi:hypothetical protein